MKKIILLVSLIVALSSCGGGGGGGAPQTNSATPQIPGGTQSPLMPVPPMAQNPIGPQNSVPNNPNNQNNPNNPGISVEPEIPKNIEIPTGKGVKVGVLDDDFVSGSNAITKRFYIKDDFHGLLSSGTPFDEVLAKEFGNRFVALTKDEGVPGKDDHGLIVATILGGKSGKGAKGASVYGVSFGEPNSLIIDIKKYKELKDKGVTIYNQSFGTPRGYSEFTINNYKNGMYGSVLRGNATHNELDKKVTELMDFYREAVNEGALFIWAAGNTDKGRTFNEPTIQAGLPHFIPSLHKGWIAVVGVKPDGREYDTHLARAGGARYWTISANGNCELATCTDIGSSFAAPRVSASAAKIKERFPWMTGHEIKQTILTTAKDIGQPGVDTIFGWGLLDEEKALKGPAQFSKELIVGERAANAGAEAKFNANIPAGMVSIFENDITGLGGLEKSGNGTLILTGDNTYSGITYVEEGKLSIYKENGSNIRISPQGTVMTYPKTVIGLRNFDGTFLPVNVDNNGGTFENTGSGAVITGNYTAARGSVTKADIGTKLTVKGTVNLNGENTLVQTVKNRYVTAKPMNEAIIEAEKGINGNFTKVETPELINASSEVTGNNLTVTLSRKNVEEYVTSLETTDEMRRVAAQNIETS
ncbi:autotransporter outer membrane beta-barrel domain-containing protein, partial [Leptotrichia sp. OH3620_COT-345]|uniref:S8 family serine peptidase n=1 Tax=Leptotrichia sp. OH3620_COT-345 TaxID=2491048 RepID=UPI000FB50E1B